MEDASKLTRLTQRRCRLASRAMRRSTLEFSACRASATRWSIASVCLFIASLVLVIGLAATTRAVEPAEAPRLLSPDGRRAVRLNLLGFDPKAESPPGMNKELFDAARKRGPSLQIEFSMILGTNEILIRPFTASPGSNDKARYRVLWDDGGRRFLVLCDAPPKKMEGSRTDTPTWVTGEHILFFFDRLNEIYPPTERYKPEEWRGAIMKGPDKGSVLPLVSIDFRNPPKSERTGRTGEMRRSLGRPLMRDRIHNFTIHSNTQNLRKTEQRTLFMMPTVRTNLVSPDGRFEVQLAGTTDPMVLLSEGEAFRDQLWVLLHHFRINDPAADSKPAEGPLFVWSRDSRHLFLLTRESGTKGLVRLENGEEVYLLFDTRRWEGVVGPSEKEIESAGFPR